MPSQGGEMRQEGPPARNRIALRLLLFTGIFLGMAGQVFMIPPDAELPWVASVEATAQFWRTLETNVLRLSALVCAFGAYFVSVARLRIFAYAALAGTLLYIGGRVTWELSAVSLVWVLPTAPSLLVALLALGDACRQLLGGRPHA